ncbi:MAG: hypothetical protein RIT81_04325 [Deltaproteobacteria bacterium]
MASHFSTIGLPVDSASHLEALVDRLLPTATVHSAGRHGRYLLWQDGSGAQVWMQVDNHGDIVGVQPHFEGSSRLRVGLTERVARDALDGAFHGWAAPSDDDAERGAYPFMFDAPDFGTHPGVRLPSVAQVQVAAFAHELALFDSVEAYEAAQTREHPFASQSFIPTGLFEEDREAMGLCTRHVVRAGCRTNRHSGLPFYWAELETYAAQLDVLIDPELIERPPRGGDVLQGTFWLSGRLIDYERAGWRALLPRRRSLQ